MCYSFADCVLDTDAVTLTVHGSSVPVQPQVVDVLALLIDERDPPEAQRAIACSKRPS